MRAFEEAPMEALGHNKQLCGNNTGLDCPIHSRYQGNKKNISKVSSVILPAFGCMLVLFFIGVILFYLHKTNPNNKYRTQETEANPFTIWSYDGKMVYESIMDALEDFDSKHIVGVGGYGTVYKAELSTKFLSGGNLRKVLNHLEQAVEFDWEKRVMAIKGIAKALSYMHHDCSQPIIHRDLSSNNILFDSDWVAHISDFGMARLLKPESSNWTSFAGTFGYPACNNSR
ncbi:putative protein kinase RLK-Pelle-LRR-XI-1 family [Helianthus anomalus]